MNLLVVTNDFPPILGGIENYIYSLVKRWPPSSVAVVTRQAPDAGKFDAQLDFEVHRRPVNRLLPNRTLISFLKEIIAERRVDLIHFPSALPLGVLGASLGLPYAVSVHGGEFLLASRLPGVRSVLKKVCLDATVLLAESSFAETLVDALVGRRAAVERITCGVEIGRFGKGTAVVPEGLKSGSPTIVSVGRLIARKGQRTLVKAMPAILRRHSRAQLLIVGGGPDLPKLRRLSEELGVSGSVTLTGPRPWDEIPGYYCAGNVFALPTAPKFLGTETEGLPLVFVEAAATGIPLVGGKAGGVHDAVRDGETGYVVDGESVTETAAALLRILNDPSLAARLGSAARRMAEKEFDWDHVASNYRQTLESYWTHAKEEAGGFRGFH